jgi:hypothetical protein
MDPNNIGLMVEDALDESNFSMVSSNGMDDSKEMAEQKSEVIVEKFLIYNSILNVGYGHEKDEWLG